MTSTWGCHYFFKCWVTPLPCGWNLQGYLTQHWTFFGHQNVKFWVTYPPACKFPGVTWSFTWHWKILNIKFSNGGWPPPYPSVRSHWCPFTEKFWISKFQTLGDPPTRDRNVCLGEQEGSCGRMNTPPSGPCCRQSWRTSLSLETRAKATQTLKQAVLPVTLMEIPIQSQHKPPDKNLANASNTNHMFAQK